MRKMEEKADPYLIVEQEEPFVPSKGWAEMIKKVYELDPLLCPSWGGQMRIISFIEDPKVIDKIIRHLKLSFQAKRPPPSPVVLQELLMVATAWRLGVNCVAF